MGIGPVVRSLNKIAKVIELQYSRSGSCESESFLHEFGDTLWIQPLCDGSLCVDGPRHSLTLWKHQVYKPLPLRIDEEVSRAQAMYYRLVLVVGPPRTGKTRALRTLMTQHGWPLINVSADVSEKLLDLTSRQRALRVSQVLDDIIDRHGSDVTLLDNNELLFSVDLHQDPLRLLQGLSRKRTLIASWSGEISGDSLTYAMPPHPEFRRYIDPQAIIVSASKTQDAEDPYGGEEKSA